MGVHAVRQQTGNDGRVALLGSLVERRPALCVPQIDVQARGRQGKQVLHDAQVAMMRRQMQSRPTGSVTLQHRCSCVEEAFYDGERWRAVELDEGLHGLGVTLGRSQVQGGLPRGAADHGKVGGVLVGCQLLQLSRLATLRGIEERAVRQRKLTS
eukprot:scaffold92914_cov27-Prasinocladus_malaysianus.AAC.2